MGTWMDAGETTISLQPAGLIFFEEHVQAQLTSLPALLYPESMRVYYIYMAKF